MREPNLIPSGRSGYKISVNQKRRGNDARMPFSLIYLFALISIFYIPHNYVIPQAMPHAIPQTHSAFYPHRKFFDGVSRNVLKYVIEG